MSEQDPGSLPPDYDAPGQVDYPDPAFEGEVDEEEVDLETPDDYEPDAPDDEDDDEGEDEE